MRKPGALLLFLFAMIGFTPVIAYGASDPVACDADFMNQIYMRAWLEGQREMIKAEVLLRKPDSILEYTCFDQLANIAGTKAGPIFSDSTRWMGHSVPINGQINTTAIPQVTMNTAIGPGHLSKEITNLVILSLVQYINLNFKHKFLGGAAKTLDWQMQGGGDYNCKYMDQVYFLSKCSDIVTDDRFWTFKELISPDPRLLPEPCTQGTNITQVKIDVSENKDFGYVNFDAVDPTYLNIMDPAAACSAPVPTGLIVVDKKRSKDAFNNVVVTSTRTYPDMVCPTPNCYYTGTECKR